MKPTLITYIIHHVTTYITYPNSVSPILRCHHRTGVLELYVDRCSYPRTSQDFLRTLPAQMGEIHFYRQLVEMLG